MSRGLKRIRSIRRILSIAKSDYLLIDNYMKKLIIISGPTACGKTSLSIELAKKMNGEIVNIDSVQVYKEFDIGSAKISKEEMPGITHHLIDEVDPSEHLDVASYIKKANLVIDEILSRSKVPIVVGGSSLYIKALLYGLSDLPKADKALREELDKKSIEEIYTELKELDPESLINISKNDRLRLSRALEIIKLSGKKQSDKNKEHNFENNLYSALIIIPYWKREELYSRINERSRLMLDQGLIEETKGIILKYGEKPKALLSLGYKETLLFLNSKITENELFEEISKNTRRYAKRQITFWNNEGKKRNWTDLSLIDSKDVSFIKSGDKEVSVLDLGYAELIEYISNEYSRLEKEINLLRINAKKLIS